MSLFMSVINDYQYVFFLDINYICCQFDVLLLSMFGLSLLFFYLTYPHCDCFQCNQDNFHGRFLVFRLRFLFQSCFFISSTQISSFGLHWRFILFDLLLSSILLPPLLLLCFFLFLSFNVTFPHHLHFH